MSGAKEAIVMGMETFTGSVLHTIDPKGRIFIPANYREALGNSFTICLNNDLRTIALYPKERWDEKCRELRMIPDADRRGRNYVRYILKHAYTDMSLDSQGRILIPSDLRQDFLKESKEGRFIGVGDYLELWNPDSYNGLEMEENELIDGTLDYIYQTYFRVKANADA